jgi:hypothetical protein
VGGDTEGLGHLLGEGVWEANILGGVGEGRDIFKGKRKIIYIKHRLLNTLHLPSQQSMFLYLSLFLHSTLVDHLVLVKKNESLNPQNNQSES